VGKPTRPLTDYVSAALRERSLDQLEAAFARFVESECSTAASDTRDVMVNLVPFIDCARRLGYDPEETLRATAQSGAAWFEETFRRFVRRSDITLAAFGWSLIETSDGVAYRWAVPNRAGHS
jgi:hypothetical protein